MFFSARTKFVASIAVVVFLLELSGTSGAQDNYEYDARGGSAHRQTFNQFPWEHVDPMTGNLVLTFTELAWC